MPKTRLITIQGPLQLLNVLSVLNFQRASEEFEVYDDILLIGDFYIPQSNRAYQEMLDTCLAISNIWQFKARIKLTEIGALFSQNICDFNTAAQLLKEQLNLKNVDIIYVCRNWQLFNELVLAAFPESYKICYGDGLGFFDFKHIAEGNTFHNPSGVSPIHEAFAITPVEIEPNILEQTHINLVEPTFFKSTIADCIQHIHNLIPYCNHLTEKLQQPATLVLTTNGSESGMFCSLEQEIESYLRTVIAHTKEGESILVKGHPRETFHQSALLAALLRESGRNALSVSNFTTVPIEVFSSLLPLKTVITLYSSSCASLAYLHQASLDILVGVGNEMIHHYLSKAYQKSIQEQEKIYEILVTQAYQNRFAPVQRLDGDQLPSCSQPVLFQNGKKTSPSHSQIATLDVSLLPKKILSVLNSIPEKNIQYLHLEKQLLVSQHYQLLSQKTDLEQTQAQNKQLQLELELLQNKESGLVDTDYQALQIKLKRSQAKCQELKRELKEVRGKLIAMESSKFWKMRSLWFKAKKLLGTKEENVNQTNASVSENSQQAVASPLTGSTNVTLLKTYSTQQLIQDWKNSFQIDITQELGQHSEIQLYECQQTHLKFFIPLDTAGSSQLYEKLEKFSWYYMPEKWEYDIALRDLTDGYLTGGQTVLEVGSGFGYFVKAGLEAGLKIRGIELNEKAVAIAQQNNLPVERIDLKDAAILHETSFDAVCSFQVLEHIPQPKEFIEWSLKLLKPGGKLVLGVPNAHSFLKYQYCLLDMPPHHMHLWSKETFQALENLFPIKLEKVEFEPLASYHVEGFLHAYQAHYSSQSAIGKLVFNRRILPFYKKCLDLGLRRWVTGQSLYVRFRKI